MNKYAPKAILATIIALIVIILFFSVNALLDYAISPVPMSEAMDSPVYFKTTADELEDKTNAEELTEDAVESEQKTEKKKNKKSDEEILMEAIETKITRDSYKWLKANSSVISITSNDGLKLNAYYGKNKSHNYAIVMHGYRSNPLTVSPYAEHFYKKYGMNIIVPGQRGHGWSEGNFIDMGYFARFDVLSWINYINHSDKNAKIVIFGVSMGAATIMGTTGLEVPSNVLCAIEDCGYSNIGEVLGYQMKQQFGIPKFPIIPLGSIACKLNNKYSFSFSIKKELTKSKTPTLFIHGSQDTFVPFYMLDINYNACSAPKDKLIVEGAFHAKSVYKAPDLYWNKIDSFLGEYFK